MGKHVEYEGDSTVLCDSIHIGATGQATTIPTNNGTLQMLDTIWPGNASFPDATYSVTGQGGQVTVDQQGLVLAVADGVDTVRVTTQDGQTLYDEWILTISNQSAATIPTITTTTATEYHSVQATTGGNVTADGGASVTTRGVCWSTSQNPTTSDSHTTDGTGTGAFTSLMFNLQNYTWYYIRAYATNSEGTAYGDQRIVLTSHYSTLRGSDKTYKLNGSTIVY